MDSLGGESGGGFEGGGALLPVATDWKAGYMRNVINALKLRAEEASGASSGGGEGGAGVGKAGARPLTGMDNGMTVVGVESADKAASVFYIVAEEVSATATSGGVLRVRGGGGAWDSSVAALTLGAMVAVWA